MKKAMTTLACLLIFAGTLCAQEKPPAEPYRLNNDVLGESLEEFRHNNPKCVFERFEKGVGKGMERTVDCSPQVEGQEDSPGEPDTNYAGIPLYGLRAVFRGKDGLVMLSFEFHSADAVRLEEQLLRDVGSPVRYLDWNNGTSWIHLQEGGGGKKQGDAIFMQEKFRQEIWDWSEKKAQQNEPPGSKDSAQR